MIESVPLRRPISMIETKSGKRNRREVSGQRVAAPSRRVAQTSLALDQRSRTSSELLRIAGLHDVVVHPGSQRDDLGVLAAICGKEDERNASKPALLAKAHVEL